MSKLGDFWKKISKKLLKTRFLKMDFSFVVMFLLAIVLGELKLFVTYFVFLMLHELTHFFVAKKLGYLAKQIHLSFFGAALEGCDDFSAADEIKIILAGPLFNLLVVVVCYLSFWFYPESYNYLQEVLTSNIALLLFNILPIYPLDMGRIIHALLSTKYERKQALKITKNTSLAVICIMFSLFLVSFFYDYDFRFGFVCVNLTVLLFSSSKGTSYKRTLFIERKFRLISKGLIERNIYVGVDTPHFKLFKFIDDYHYVNFVFINSEFDVVNTLSEVELYRECGIASV